MSCASCGKQVAAGARYCIHCGAEQAVPTPIAAVAAASMSMARAARGEAANAAHAEPAPRDPPRPSVAASAIERAGAAGIIERAGTVNMIERAGTADMIERAGAADIGRPPATLATDGAGAAHMPIFPAYASGPARRGLAVALIGTCVIVAIAALGIVGGRLSRTHVDTTAPGINATSAHSAPAAASAVTPPAASVPAAPVPEAASSTNAVGADAGTPIETPPLPSSASIAATGNPGAVQDAPVEIKALPPHVAARPSRRAPVAKEATVAPAPPVETAAREPVPAAPANRIAAAAAPAAVPVADRWHRMNDELSRCTRQDFIARVVCGQRVRFRYCDGYWGKVPACPSNPAPEHGQ
jgi:hypothetical protein